MKTLILIDQEYPYNKAETFLENEISQIAINFNKIIIYPEYAMTRDVGNRRSLPPNVDSVALNNKTTILRRISCISGIVKYFTKTNKQLGIKKRIIEAYFISAAYGMYYRIAKDIRKKEFHKDEEIYIYSYWFHVGAKAAALLANQFKVDGYKSIVFSRAHGLDLYEERSQLNFLPHRKELLNELDGVFVCSKNGAEYLRRKYSIFNDKIYTSLLGTRDYGTANHKYNKDEFRIVTCSRIVSVKRLELIIETFAKFPQYNLKITWTHIGSGPIFNQIKRQVDEKIPEMTVELLGEMTNQEVYNFYLHNNIDLFLNVSSSEGIPVSIMEAISFGVPVIATNVGGVSEIVKDSMNGFLLEKDFKEEELFCLVNKVINMDKSQYEKLRVMARRIWCQKFCAEKNYQVFINYIEALYNRKYLVE